MHLKGILMRLNSRRHYAQRESSGRIGEASILIASLIMSHCSLAKGTRDASGRWRDVGSHRTAQRTAMIAKTFFLT
jgi:hypothetical protein